MQWRQPTKAWKLRCLIGYRDNLALVNAENTIGWCNMIRDIVHIWLAWFCRLHVHSIEHLTQTSSMEPTNIKGNNSDKNVTNNPAIIHKMCYLACFNPQTRLRVKRIQHQGFGHLFIPWKNWITDTKRYIWHPVHQVNVIETEENWPFLAEI